MNVAFRLSLATIAFALGACAPSSGQLHQSVNVTLRSDLQTHSSNLTLADLPARQYCYALHIVDESTDGPAELRNPNIWSQRDCDSAPNSLGQLIWLGDASKAQKLELPVSTGKKIRFDLIAIKTSNSGAVLGPDASCNYNLALDTSATAKTFADVRYKLTAKSTGLSDLVESTTTRFDIRLVASKRNFEVVAGSNSAVLDYAKTFTDEETTDFGYYGSCTPQPAKFCDYGMRRQYSPADGKFFARTIYDKKKFTTAHNGTVGKPFEICSPEQFANMRTLVKNEAMPENAFITLKDDIDFGNRQIMPIGDQANAAFSSNFDGGGNTISNVFVVPDEDYTDPVGLFGAVATSDDNQPLLTIKNLTLVNVAVLSNSVDSPRDQVGALAGFLQNVTLTDIYLINDDKHYIYNNRNSCGGLVGYAEFSSELGQDLTWSHLYAQTNVACNQQDIGGIAGNIQNLVYGYDSKWIINEVAFNGAVGYYYGDGVGGLFGHALAADNTPITIQNSYVYATVKGINAMGGAVGNSEHMTFANNFFGGTLKATESTATAVGGVTGSAASATFSSKNALNFTFNISRYVTSVGYVIGSLTDDSASGGHSVCVTISDWAGSFNAVDSSIWYSSGSSPSYSALDPAYWVVANNSASPLWITKVLKIKSIKPAVYSDIVPETIPLTNDTGIGATHTIPVTGGGVINNLDPL